MSKTLAGIDVRDLSRLSDGTALNLVEEVVSFVRQATGRRGNSLVSLLDVIDDVVAATGCPPGEVQSAFDIAYQDHRIIIDKDGYVRLVDGRKRRSAMLRTPDSQVLDVDLWHKAKKQIGISPGSKDYWKKVLGLYSASGGKFIGPPPTCRTAVLHSMVSHFQIPIWVKDAQIWSKALLENNPEDTLYWGKVHLAYLRAGGRVAEVHSKSAQIQPRPFDVHPPIWTVTTDGFLSRDLAAIQAFIGDGVEPEDLVSELVSVGASNVDARRIVTEALEGPILI